ncbi:transcription factor domain-containing protein, partial [Aspergillus thermomutatus]
GKKDLPGKIQCPVNLAGGRSSNAIVRDPAAAVFLEENAILTDTVPSSQGPRSQPRETGAVTARSITIPRSTRTSNESLKTADWLENIVMADRLSTAVSRHLPEEVSLSEAAHDPSRDNGDSRLGEVISDFFRHRLASSENPMTVDLVSYLPEKSKTMALFRYYCDYIDYLYHVIIPSRVEDQINRIYHCSDKGLPVNLAQLALLFSILASSVCFQCSSGPSTFAERCSREFTFLAGAALIRSNYIARPTLEGLQASLIVIHYLPNPSLHPSICSLFLPGTIINQAKNLMLHCIDSPRCQEEREANGFDALELELKRRLWWDIASFDWLLGFLSGPQEWTYLINPRLMNVREPLNIDDEGIQGTAVATPSPMSEPTQMSFTLQRLNLAVVCREIVDMTAYEHMHGVDVGYDKILELDRKLHQAYNDLPEFYRLDTISRRRFAPLYRSQPKIAWQRCLLQQAYHSRFCRLHRLYFIRGAREPAYSYSHVICLQSARKVLEIKRIMDEDEPRFMPPTSTVWSVMHHVFMAAVILLMDVCFNWDDLLADKRKQEVLDACRMLSKAQQSSSLVSQGIQAMMDVLQKHWKSGKHSSTDGQPSNLPSSPALGATAVAEPAQIAPGFSPPYQDSANTIDNKDASVDPSFLIDHNDSQERPLEDIWTEMLDSGGDLNFATPDWTDLLTELTNATLPCS